MKKIPDPNELIECPICRPNRVPLYPRNMIIHARKVHGDILLEDFPFPKGTAENCYHCHEWYYPGPGGDCPTPNCPGTQPGDRATYREPHYKPHQDAMYGPRSVQGGAFESNRHRH